VNLSSADVCSLSVYGEVASSSLPMYDYAWMARQVSPLQFVLRSWMVEVELVDQDRPASLRSRPSREDTELDNINAAIVPELIRTYALYPALTRNRPIIGPFHSFSIQS
jgi:hypothetical protein